MASILLLFTQYQQVKAVLEPCKTIANLLNTKLIVSSYNDHKLSEKKKCEELYGEEEITGSENNLPETVNHLINKNIDIILVIHPYLSFFNRKQQIRNFFLTCHKLKVPYLILPSKTKSGWIPENIVVPLWLKRGEKEALIWAGNLHRSMGSKVTIIHPEFKNNSTQKNLGLLIRFASRLYENSNVSFEIKKTGGSRKEIKSEIIRSVSTLDNTIIATPSSDLLLLDCLLFKMFDFDIIQKQEYTPVLYVNPRRDLYVPCN